MAIIRAVQLKSDILAWVGDGVRLECSLARAEQVIRERFEYEPLVHTLDMHHQVLRLGQLIMQHCR